MTTKQRDALKALNDAITQYDVGGTIADEDVNLWNAVIKSNKALRLTLEAGERC